MNIERVLIGGITVLTIGLFIALGILIVDMVSYTSIQDTSVITGKEYEPATTRTVASIDAKGNPTTRAEYVPERFILLLQTENSGHVTVEVDQSIYDLVEVGASVRYSYHKGIIGGTVSHERVAID